MSWAFTEQKIEKRIQEVRAARILERVIIGDVRIAQRREDDGVPLGHDLSWGRDKEITVWIKFRVDGGDVLHVKPVDCEILAYVDGLPVQAFDAEHHEMPLPGRPCDVVLEAYSGLYQIGTDPSVVAANLPPHGLAALESWRVHKPAEALAYDLLYAYQTAVTLDVSRRERGLVLQALDDAINLLDFRQGNASPAFYKSVVDVEYALRKVIERIPLDPNAPVLWAAGHAHIDTAWLWRTSHTRVKCAHTFATVLALMERYPEYHFTCSQPQQYQYVKEDHPEIYEGIRRAVKDGRWETVGGMWVESDCNVVGGEAMVRQFLYGTRFFDKEFGTRSDVVWLPDVFGYSAAFPQIIRKAGMKIFMTIKIFWNQVNKPPYQTFKWVGIDGSDVLVHFSPLGDYNARMEPAQFKKLWDGYAQKNLTDSALYIYGFGDGGGGPTPDMLEMAERGKAFPAGPRVKLATTHAFFEDLERQLDDRLPVWNGELYLEYHRGTYTSQGRNKKQNRDCEILFQTAEQCAAMASILCDAPWKSLEAGWRVLLLNQFHDILPGSSIREVYEDTDRDYAALGEQGSAALDGALQTVAARVAGDGVLLYNPLSWERADVARVPAAWGLPGQQVKDWDGVKHTLLAAHVPSCGWTVTAGAADETSYVRADSHLLENKFFRLTLDDNGEISSLWDKRVEREVIDTKRGTGNALITFEDKPLYWDAWDVDIFYQDKAYPLRKLFRRGCVVVERGPLRAAIEIERRVDGGRGSLIRQKICIYRDSPGIDFETEIDWQERQTLLKVAFPVTVNSLRATYDIQFGNVERPTHWNTSWDWARFEVCGHKWADLSEGDYGVSILNDGKYGWDIRDSVMRLTLLKSAISPDPEADQGIHRFTYSLLAGPGDWRAGETIRHAYELNNPTRAVRLPGNGDGSLPETFSMFTLDAPNLVIETVKRAEDERTWIIRIYESHNQRGTATLTCARPIESAECVNLLEHDLDGPQPEVNDTTVRFTYGPYEIKTLKLLFTEE